MAKTHWMVRLVQVASLLFLLFGCFMVLIYSPFYSQWIVKGLNTFVPLQVNEVAAKSQQQAALSEHESLEPGSKLWIARQAYLKLMEETIKSKNSPDLTVLQARYKALQGKIEEAQIQENEEQEKPRIPLLVKEQDSTSAEQESDSVGAQDDPTQAVKDLLNLNSNENKVLMEKYLEFLQTHPVENQEIIQEKVDESLYQDIAQIHEQNENEQSQVQSSKPYAIVVLGGGLTLDQNRQNIVVNDYTRLRLEKTLAVEKQYKLPIVLSGVEAPYMQRWLKQHDVDAKLLEDRSMNTCENSRFSSLLLQKKGGAPRVILITDRYHMPRTRRLFALNGIETVPIEAPMPTQLTQWRPSEKNYDHSRRANYEMLATIRDVWFGSSDCREVP